MNCLGACAPVASLVGLVPSDCIFHRGDELLRRVLGEQIKLQGGD